MRDIASAAGVSRTTLYKYYPRIEDVLQATFSREFDRFEEKITGTLEKTKTPQDKLKIIVIGLAENEPKGAWIKALVSGYRTQTEDKALAAGRAALDERIEKMIDEPLNELAEKKLLRTDIDRQLVIDWIRILVHALSAVRHPGIYTSKRRKTLVDAFLVKSVLK